MKTKTNHLLIALTLLAGFSRAGAQGVVQGSDGAFTYQGRLDHGSNVLNVADMTFTLFNTNTGGSASAGPITNAAVLIGSNNLFTTTVSFGTNSTLYSGQAYLEIAVRTNGAGVFTTLSPRQPLTAAPLSLYAASAGVANVANAVASTTVIGGQSLDVGVNNTATGTLTTIAGGTSNNVSSNYGTIGGGTGNEVSGNVGVVGGGSSNFATGDHAAVFGGELNYASGTHAVVCGGYFNVAGSDFDVCVGGVSNIVTGDPAFLGGGFGNWVYGYASWGACGLFNRVFASYSGLGGGAFNTIQTNANFSFLGGGFFNTIQSNATFAVISGGDWNTIQTNSTQCVISGGTSNTIQINCSDSAVAGGYRNTIQSGNAYSAIGGGQWNNIFLNSPGATIAGGQTNSITANNAAIGGGSYNTNQSSASTIAGGAINNIQTSSDNGTIAGGRNNVIQFITPNSTIGGGNNNNIGATSSNSVIAGGWINTIKAVSPSASMGGGFGNVIQLNSPYATIPGGQQALATNYAQFAYSSGQFATAGDSQYSLYVLRGSTVSNNVQTLYLDGANATREIILPNNRVCAITVSIVGVELSSNHRCLAFHVRGVANGYLAQEDDWNNDPAAGYMSLGLPDAYSTPNTFASTFPLPIISVGGGRLHVQVSGNSGVGAMRWTATVQTTEESF